MARVGPAVIAIDDEVYAIGGENAEGPLRSMEEWNPDRERWIAVERMKMKVPRVRHTATVLEDGQFLVAGGGGDHPDSRLAELWDGAHFVPAGRMLSARSRHTATRLQDGRVLVIGGRDQRGIPIGDAEIWDPKSRTWHRAGRLIQARCCHTATLLRDGRVLVVGGLVTGECTVWGDEKPKPPCYRSVDSVEIWDPKTSRFTAGPGLGDNEDRAAHTATLLNDGRVLIAGGAPNDGDGDPYTLHDLVWEPATSTWHVIEQGAFRVYHTATLLPDGSVLAIGGARDTCGCCKVVPGSGPYASPIKLFDPATNLWRIVGESLEVRDRHGAVALSDGSVLVVGGESQEWGHRDAPFATTERWMPHDQKD
ncbi:MAG TPA: kelch repeat-containing protein [Kofleriaceae bacterium]|nr:kelch repeat-containing protein [Kofleriaceae bacterium]